jgi:CubicO group peptidase (beta-lactamase class C family)
MQPSCLSVLKLALGAVMLMASLGSAAAEEAQASDWPTKGWQTSTPEEQGIDPAALAKLVEFGAGQSMDSLLIVRHGKIVLDAYYAPYSADMPHVVNSVTKAVVGTLASIASQDGLLQGPDQSMLSFFADRSVANLDDNKKAITLQSLFDMTSGLDWQEPLGPGTMQSVIDMERSRNWVEFILDRPMAHPPGEVFNYDSGNPHLVSAILAKVTGMRTEDYARTKLFAPLGISAWKWRRDPQGVTTGGYGLSLHPRDMAKFGYLYLRGGVWDGAQLVPSTWVHKVSHASIDMKLSFAPGWRYANFFWASPGQDVYWAAGYHCQLIMVYPKLDLVAVTTGRNDCAVTRLMSTISNAVKSPTAIAADPAGAELLANALRAVATEKPTDVGATPPIAAAVSGKIYNFPRNPLGVKSLSLTFAGADLHYDFELYTRNSSKPPEKISGPIGLDGLYRKGMETPFGPLAVKGRWLDDHVFEVERINIGASEKSRKWTLSFDGEKLSLRGKNFEGVDIAIDSQEGG